MTKNLCFAPNSVMSTYEENKSNHQRFMPDLQKKVSWQVSCVDDTNDDNNNDQEFDVRLFQDDTAGLDDDDNFITMIMMMMIAVMRIWCQEVSEML